MGFLKFSYRLVFVKKQKKFVNENYGEINTLVAESIVILWYLVLWLVLRSSRADLKYTIVPRVMITGWYYCMVIQCNSPFVFEH